MTETMPNFGETNLAKVDGAPVLLKGMVVVPGGEFCCRG